MHKRILCVLLAALILLTLIPAFALPSQAASNMKTGEGCIKILKQMEGFLKYPIWDYSHYSVGYGSTCGKDDYPNGITEAEADALLRAFLADMEKELNRFANRHSILFSQNQFDALMLFTYNCGTGWLYGDGDLRQAVLNDTIGNSFIYYMTQWSVAGGEILPGLVTRRLIESDMYLNGSYTNVKPASYTFIRYDNNGGEGSPKIQGYDSNLPAFVKSTPTRAGCNFLGWYSEAEGGSWITELSAQNAEQTLYAHWQGAENTVENPCEADYQLSSDLLVSREFYDMPNGTAAGSLSEDAIAQIKGEFVDRAGIKWGKLSNDCWVSLGNPRIGTGDESDRKTGVKVNVTGDYVNVRTGPGTQFNAIAAVLEGDQILITETVDVAGVLWGKFRAGWVCLQYTDYAGGLAAGQPDNSGSGQGGNEDNKDTVVATGTVIVDGLNIRVAAGTNGQRVGYYTFGDKVKFFEKTSVSGTPWGRTDKGWICLTYVELDEAEQTPETSEPETTVPETTVPETTVPETTVPETTVPETTVPGAEEEKPDDDVRGIPATVISKGVLNIRSGAGTNFTRAGYYSPGQKIEILEQKTVSGILWGRTEQGWVSMQYVRLDEQWSNESGVYGKVITNGNLNIRSGPGVGYRPVGSYSAGSRIVILEQTVAAGQKWGRTELGWVCMDFVRLEASVETPGETEGTEATEPETTVPETTVPGTTEPEEEPDTVTGVVTAYYLNIRGTAGVSGKVISSYKQGDKVEILEQTLVNGAAWGRTDKGWISLAYVDLDLSQTQKPGNEGNITATVLYIRKGPGTGNAIVGTYMKGEKVTILETVKAGTTTWGRTDKGWICMDYVK